MLLTKPIHSPHPPSNDILNDVDSAAPIFTMAQSVARKFARGEGRIVPFDELLAESLYGLAYAQHRFKPTLNVPFSKYAMMVICHRLRNLVQRWHHRLREVPYPRSKFDPEVEWHPCSREDFRTMGNNLDAEELWHRVRNVVTERVYNILVLHFQEGISPRQIGTQLGISKQRVCQLIAKAMRKLRETWAHAQPEI